MLAALVAAVVLLVIALGVCALVAVQLVGAKDERLADRTAELHIARTRIAHLELTIDEIRARELSTSAPAPAVVQPPRPPLPPAIQSRLDEIDDASGEIEELARAKLEANPDADPNEIADELFI